VGLGRAEPSSYVADLFEKGEPVAWLSIGVVLVVSVGLAVTIASSKRYADDEA
jgi:hypothetical protein